jgi:hypothetical protein
MKTFLTLFVLFFLVACNSTGYNSSTLKYSKVETDKNFLKKLHNWIISADEFLNTETNTHASTYSSGGKTVTCNTTIERHGLDASTFGIYERKIRKISSSCDDGYSSTTTYE